MSDRGRWLRSRAEGIGASESAAILGLSPFISAYALWAKKTGLVQDDEEETELQRWGNILEPAICEEYAEQTGRRIIDHGRYAVRRSETCPVMLCTLDREVHADDKPGPGCMEAKNVGAYRDDEWIEGPPIYYQVQVQHQMEVCGWQWASMAVLIGGNKFRWVDVERNDKFIDVLRRKCVEFWHLVETRTAPDVDGSDSTAETLRRLFPQDTGETIALPGESMGWDDQIREANEVIRAAMGRKEEAQNRIKAAMGVAAYGVLPGGGRWSLITTTRKGYEVQETQVRTLRRLKK